MTKITDPALLAENEKLRAALRATAKASCAAEVGHIVDAALSQQAEPAPAQDEREAFIAAAKHHKVEGIGFKLETTSSGAFRDNETRMLHEGWKLARSTRPAQTAPQPEQSGLNDDSKEAAMQKAFELGGLEDGSYHLESDELELVIRAALSAQGHKP